MFFNPTASSLTVTVFRLQINQYRTFHLLVIFTTLGDFQAQHLSTCDEQYVAALSSYSVQRDDLHLLRITIS